MTFEEWAKEYFGEGVSVPEACRDAWNAAQAAERNRCRYPECVENEDERCPRWLTGECGGPQ